MPSYGSGYLIRSTSWMVAVADPATVTYLQRSYGPDLRVEGWLQPVRPRTVRERLARVVAVPGMRSERTWRALQTACA